MPILMTAGREFFCGSINGSIIELVAEEIIKCNANNSSNLWLLE